MSQGSFICRSKKKAYLCLEAVGELFQQNNLGSDLAFKWHTSTKYREENQTEFDHYFCGVWSLRCYNLSSISVNGL